MQQLFLFKSALTFLGGVVVYTGLIRLLPFEPRYGQSLQAANEIQLERYIFDSQTAPGVITGSSLMARLPHEDLFPEIYNLGMRGYSALTGLEALVRSQQAPAVVFIELNTLHINTNPALLDGIFSPIAFQLKSFLPTLRTQYQPANLYRSALIEINSQGKPSAENGDAGPSPNSKLFRKLLAQKQAEMAVPPDPESLAQNLQTLKELLFTLQSRGTVPVFVEMPVDVSLSEAPRQQAIRQKTQAAFSPKDYRYLFPLQGKTVSTTDGVHLDAQGIRRVSDVLLDYQASLVALSLRNKSHPLK